MEGSAVSPGLTQHERAISNPDQHRSANILFKVACAVRPGTWFPGTECRIVRSSSRDICFLILEYEGGVEEDGGHRTSRTVATTDMRRRCLLPSQWRDGREGFLN